MRILRLIAGNAAVTLALLLTAGVAGELALRASAVPNDRVERRGRVKYRFNPYQPDTVLGYAHRPDWQTVHETAEFRVTVRTNRLGLRGGPVRVPKPAGIFRVLAVGDSFTFGWGVQEDEAFPARLEAELPPPAGYRETEVLNAGVPGWSADTYFLYLRDRGLALEPDLLLLAPMENDIPDLGLVDLEVGADGLPLRTRSRIRLIDQRGRMHYVDGGPLSLPRIHFPGQLFLAEHSRLYQFLGYRLARAWVGISLRRAEARQREAAGPPPEGPIETLAPEEIRRGLASGPAFRLRYHRFLVRAIRELAREHGVAVRVLLIQGRGPDPPPDSPLAELRAECDADPICIRSATLLRGLDPDEAFYPADGHWRAAAHAAVARGLARWLEAQDLAPPAG